MAVRLYFDHNVRRTISIGLRLRDVDVVTAFEDGSHELADPDLLDRTASLGRVLFTHDDDLLAEAARRQDSGMRFAGVIFVHQEQLGIGQTVDELELIARASDPEDLRDAVLFLPL